MQAHDEWQKRLIERFGSQYQFSDELQGWQALGWLGPYRLRVPAAGARYLDGQPDDRTQDRFFYGPTFEVVAEQALAADAVRH